MIRPTFDVFAYLLIGSLEFYSDYSFQSGIERVQFHRILMNGYNIGK